MKIKNTYWFLISIPIATRKLNVSLQKSSRLKPCSKKLSRTLSPKSKSTNENK